MQRRPTVLIVGGGILGLFTACLAAERGYRVMLFRLTDRHRPRSDTLRNHSWLHSGLLYAETDLKAATLMRRWGEAMLDYTLTPRPVERGVYAFSTEETEAHFLESADQMGMASRLTRLTSAEAQNLLGPFASDIRVAYQVPDKIFDEARLLCDLRDIARGLGVPMYEFEQGVLVEHRDGYPMAVTPAGNCFADVVVLAAGAGNIGLLEGLGVSSPLEISCSPLLRVPGRVGLRANLFVHRDTDLAVVAHAPSSAASKGCLVIGDRSRRVVTGEDSLWDQRLLREDQKEGLLSLLPPSVRELARGPGVRWTAGYKTEGLLNGERLIKPWVSQGSDCPERIIAAVPVKATLALLAAERVMARILEELEEYDTTALLPLCQPAMSIDHLTPWTSRIACHHDSHYDNLNEG